MKVKSLFAALALLTCSQLTYAQEPQKVDTLIRKLDSLSKKTDSAGFQHNNISKEAYNEVTKISARNYFVLLGSNIKQGFTKPFHMTGPDWKKVAIFTGVAVGVGFADEPIQKQALSWRNSSSTVRNVGKYISNFGGLYELYSLGGLGLYGVVAKNQKIKTTTLLASQAYITGALLESVVKTLSGRTRPSAYFPNTEAEPSFKGPFVASLRDKDGRKTNSSFPSGHTTVAFAAATVFAKEYAHSAVVPIISYSAATLIGLSRITENKHWASDVLVGGFLGYLTGRQVVNNYHRFAKIQNHEHATAHFSFEPEYHFGRLMPAVIYHM